MEFILSTDLQTELPASIEFNFEQLKSEITGRIAKYNALVVTEDGIRAAKEDRASLNKLKTAIEDKRKEIKKSCMAPYDVFEARVKEIVSLIDEPIKSIDQQIKTFDEAKKEEKRVAISGVYEREIGDLRELVALEKLWNPKWLNAGFLMKDIETAIHLTVCRVLNDMGILRAMKLACETQVIDAYLQNLNMSDALAEKSRFEEQRKKIEKMNVVEQPEKQPDPPAPVQVFKAPDAARADLEELAFRVWVTLEQKALLKRFLKDNHIKYGRA